MQRAVPPGYSARTGHLSQLITTLTTSEGGQQPVTTEAVPVAVLGRPGNVITQTVDTTSQATETAGGVLDTPAQVMGPTGRPRQGLLQRLPRETGR